MSQLHFHPDQETDADEIFGADDSLGLSLDGFGATGSASLKLADSCDNLMTGELLSQSS